MLDQVTTELIEKIHESQLFGWFIECRFEEGPVSSILRKIKGYENTIFSAEPDPTSHFYLMKNPPQKFKDNKEYVSEKTILLIFEFLSNKKIILTPDFKINIFNPKINFQYLSVFSENLSNGYIGIKMTNKYCLTIYKISISELLEFEEKIIKIADIGIKMIGKDPLIQYHNEFINVSCIQEAKF